MTFTKRYKNRKQIIDELEAIFFSQFAIFVLSVKPCFIYEIETKNLRIPNYFAASRNFCLPNYKWHSKSLEVQIKMWQILPKEAIFIEKFHVIFKDYTPSSCYILGYQMPYYIVCINFYCKSEQKKIFQNILEILWCL